jgi:DNA-binding SARP family transcriptional activator/predicted ATPase/Tfp pilus assembly protein PilF
MADLELSFFGNYEARAAGARVTEFRSDKTRALLAYLAVNKNRPFRREILATLLWSDWPEEEARRNLRQTLYRLRQMLDKLAAPLGSDLLITTRQTVQINGALISLDTHKFYKLLESSDNHHHVDLASCNVCIQQLESAAALYQGDFLEGYSLKDAVPFDEWLDFERNQLRDHYLDLLGRLAQLFEPSGTFEKANRYANLQVNLAPWRESGHRQLMRLYMLQDRRSDALSQYERCIAALEAELGVDPSPETNALYQQIKDGEFDGGARANIKTKGFPTQRTPFIGRQREVPEILERISDDDCRILTLIGPGGTGKTRLSAQVGQDLSQNLARNQDGIYFVPLLAINQPGQLAVHLAKHLGIHLPEQENPKQHLLNVLKDKDLLLICDNFEHIMPAAALLGEISSAAPRVQFLVTSRQPLQLTAEWQHAVGGLSLSGENTSEAVHFFKRNARRIAPDFQPGDEDLAAVLEFCRLVEGLPLALEIGAAWTRMMDCQSILEETRRNIGFLQSPLDDLPERHRSLQAVLTQSWQTLSERVQGILCELARFPDSFSLDGAQAIVSDMTVLDVATLLDKSLLHLQVGGRYSLHELLRQFARSQPWIERDAFKARFAEHYLGVLAQQVSDLRGQQPQRAIQRIQLDRENIDQAWRWSLEFDLRANLIASLPAFTRYYHLVGLFHEAVQQLNLALASVGPAESTPEKVAFRCQLLLQLSHFFGQSGQYRAAIQAAHQAQEAAVILAESSLQAEALSLEGEWLRHLGELEQALSCFSQARELFNSPGHPGLAHVMNETGLILIKQSQFDEALGKFHQALDINERLDDLTEISTTLGNIGHGHQQKADYAVALSHIDRALSLAQSIGYKQGIVKQSLGRGGVLLEQGELAEASEAFTAAHDLSSGLGYTRGIINSQIFLGSIGYAQGNIEVAQNWYQKARSRAEEAGLQDLIAMVVGKQGIIHAMRSENQLAIADYEHAIQLWRGLQNHTELGRNLGNLGNIYLRLGQYEQAKDYFEQALVSVQAGGARQSIANAYLKLGSIYKRLGGYTRSQAYFEKALEIYETLAHKRGISMSTGWLGILHYEQGHFEHAETYYEQARLLSAEMGDELSTAVWQTNLGDVSVGRGDTEIAVERFEKAVSIFRKLANARYLAETLLKLVDLQIQSGHLDKANVLYQDAVGVAQDIDDQALNFARQIVQARLLHAGNETSEALAALHDVIGSYPQAKYQAEIYFYLWDFKASKSDGQRALSFYQDLIAETSNFQYRQKLDQLEAALSDPA